MSRRFALLLCVFLLLVGCTSSKGSRPDAGAEPDGGLEDDLDGGFNLSERKSCEQGVYGTTREILPVHSYSPVKLAWGAQPDDVWAVRVQEGTRPPGGGLFRWDGMQWTLHPLQDPLGALAIIAGSSSQDVWFAGWSDFFYHWNGLALEKVQNGARFPVSDLQIIDANTAWALAPGGDTLKQSQLLRWDGTTWSVAAELPDNVQRLWVADRDDVWLRAPAAVYRWHQGQFTIMMGGTSDAVRGIWGSGPNDIWVARTPDLMHWNGSTLEAVPGSPERVAHIWGTGSQDIWFLQRQANSVLHWNGSQFVTAASPPCLDTLCTWTSLRGTGPDDVWATSMTDVMHWDGHAWTLVEQGRTLNFAEGIRPGVWPVGAKDLWAFEPSFNQVNHWDGQQLTPVPETGEDRVARHNLFDVWALSPTDVWAVGGFGTAIHYDGVRWSPVPTGTRVDLLSVSGTASDDVWAVGRHGTVLHWDGRAWSQVQVGTSSDLEGVFAAAGDFVVVVGKEGTVLQRQAGAWSTRTGAHGELSGVWARGPDDVWAVSSTATIFHWQGDNLSEVTPRAELTGVKDIWGLEPEGAIAAMSWSKGKQWHDLDTSFIRDVWVSPRGVVWVASVSHRPLNSREYLSWYTQENCWLGTTILSQGYPSFFIELHAMHGAGERDVWFVGAYGRIFHYQLPAAP